MSSSILESLCRPLALVCLLLLGGCALAPAGREDAPVDAAARDAFAEGVALMQAGQAAEAVVVFEGLKARYPQAVAVQVNLAVAYQEAGREPEAIALLEGAAALAPQSPEVHTQLGVLYRRAGRFEDARRSYERALAADAAYRPAHLNLGILCDLYLQRLDCALEHYQRFQSLGGEPEREVTLWIADLQKRMTEASASEGGS